MAPSKAQQQDPQATERESGPRGRSAPYPHAGQTRWLGLDVVTCDLIFARLMFIYLTLSATLVKTPPR
jgi:hypothetical protein